MQRKRRELEQGRIQKELRVGEATVKIYNEELDREDVQSKLFVGERCKTCAQPNLSALADAFAAAMSLSRVPMPQPSVFDANPLKYHSSRAQRHTPTFKPYTRFSQQNEHGSERCYRISNESRRNFATQGSHY